MALLYGQAGKSRACSLSDSNSPNAFELLKGCGLLNALNTKVLMVCLLGTAAFLCIELRRVAHAREPEIGNHLWLFILKK